MFASSTATDRPVSPAMDRPEADLIFNRDAPAARGETSVVPAPVSTAKVYGPVEFSQTLTSSPRPLISRNRTGRGMFTRVEGVNLAGAAKRAVPNETALTPDATTKAAANRSLRLLFTKPIPPDSLVSRRASAQLVRVQS